MKRSSIWVVVTPNQASLFEDLVLKVPISSLGETEFVHKSMASSQSIDSVYFSKKAAEEQAQRLMNASVGNAMGIAIPRDYGVSDIAAGVPAGLTNVLDFFNSIVAWTRTNYMAMDFPNSFFKNFYNYWADMKIGELLPGTEWPGDWWWDFENGLRDVQAYNLKNPKRPIILDSSWFYRFLGRQPLNLKDVPGFSDLMSIRENLLSAIGGLDMPVHENEPCLGVVSQDDLAQITIFKQVAYNAMGAGKDVEGFADHSGLAKRVDELILIIDARLSRTVQVAPGIK
jgi:hypothetical protein